MKINKNELHSMINQIDDDLLREAQEGYGREKSHMMQRIIPVAACILIMISGIVGAALKNGCGSDRFCITVGQCNIRHGNRSGGKRCEND